MKTIVRAFGIILVITMVAGTVSAAETTPIYPGMGDSQSDFYGRYPIANSNALITQHIKECGIGPWYEKSMDTRYRSVHIPPANSCGKQLIFSVRNGAERDDPTQIADIWIIGANETWSGSMSPVNARKTPGFVMPGAILAIGLCAALSITMQRTR
jgi:hypothetical protein